MGSCFKASCLVTHSWMKHSHFVQHKQIITITDYIFIMLINILRKFTWRSSSRSLFSSSSRSRSGKKLVSTSGFLLPFAFFFKGSSSSPVSFIGSYLIIVVLTDGIDWIIMNFLYFLIKMISTSIIEGNSPFLFHHCFLLHLHLI